MATEQDLSERLPQKKALSLYLDLRSFCRGAGEPYQSSKRSVAFAWLSAKRLGVMLLP